MKRITLKYSYTVDCERVMVVSDEFAALVERDDLYGELVSNGGYDIAITPAGEGKERFYDDPAFEVDSNGPDLLTVQVSPLPVGETNEVRTDES